MDRTELSIPPIYELPLLLLLTVLQSNRDVAKLEFGKHNNLIHFRDI
uniref:Uncharacterized protein n=1 Tax=Rhizophora mucronata TaxID=61149 RepID=A0A2P2J3F0_RHIMU